MKKVNIVYSKLSKMKSESTILSHNKRHIYCFSWFGIDGFQRKEFNQIVTVKLALKSVKQLPK